jgi:autotransporter-associated beta strand protein
VPTDGSLARWRSRRGLRIAALLAGLPLFAVAAHAQNATWNLNGTGEFNTNTNWTPATVPTGMASFGESNQKNVSISSGNSTAIGGFTFASTGLGYTFTNSSRLGFFFNGAGIVNGDASVTFINNNPMGFQNSSTAGNITIFVSSELDFLDRSTAGNAAITNTGATIDMSGLTSAGMTMGSIAGGGPITLGSKNLTVGGNNASTSYSGSFQDGGFGGGGTGGSLTKVGTGTLTLTGNNTYTGATIVNGGTLQMDGFIVSSSGVTVNAGGTLSGTGGVSTIQINSGGILAPGNPLRPTGSLTSSGNLFFQSGAIYLVQVNSAAASAVNANGGASLAGTVQAVFVSGIGNPAKSYNILHTTGAIGGTFENLQTTNLPKGFTANLSYTNNAAGFDVMLNVTAALGGPQQATGLSSNHQSVAGAINNFFNDPPLPPAFLPLFSLTGGNLANALTLLSGEAATGAQQPAFQLTNQFLNIMLDPFVDGRSNVNGGSAIGFAPEREELPDDIALAYSKILKAPPKPASFEQPWSVWGAGHGGSNRTTGDVVADGSHDLAASTAGGAAGLDYRLAPGTVVGFALAGGGANWSLAQAIGAGKSDAFQAGIYGTARSGPAYLAAALAFTNHWMSTDRFAFAGDHLTSSFNAQSYGGRVESGYRFATDFGGLTPYAAIQSQRFHTPGYSETDLNGGGFALGFDSRNATDTRSELGGRFDRLLLLNPEAALTLRGRLAWAHDWVSDPTLVAVFQMLPGASFIVNGATPAKNSALVSEGAELRLANGVLLLAKFDGEFASHSSTYAGTGTVRYTW